MAAPTARAVGADADQWEREGGGSKLGAREEGRLFRREHFQSCSVGLLTSHSPNSPKHQHGCLSGEEVEVFEKPGLPPVLHCCRGGGETGARNP